MTSEERKGEVKERTELRCSICECTVYQCDGCGEYLSKGEEIICIDDKHYCDGCFDEPREKVD